MCSSCTEAGRLPYKPRRGAHHGELLEGYRPRLPPGACLVAALLPEQLTSAVEPVALFTRREAPFPFLTASPFSSSADRLLFTLKLASPVFFSPPRLSAASRLLAKTGASALRGHVWNRDLSGFFLRLLFIKTFFFPPPLFLHRK